MLEAYAGRADAYQKAAEAARRMTGDVLAEAAFFVGSFAAPGGACTCRGRRSPFASLSLRRNPRPIAAASI